MTHLTSRLYTKNSHMTLRISFLLLSLSFTATSLALQTPFLHRSSRTRQSQVDASRRRVTQHERAPMWRRSELLSYADDAPSDYDSDDLQDFKSVMVDSKEEDARIRDALKRELLLLSSVTNRGEYATLDEQNILIDLISQLEALNPTANPASNSNGEWDLCLSSTQFFRSSPFFQSIRIAAGDDNKAVVENGFDLHDRATSASRIGRVRQSITSKQLKSEVDLEVGITPGLPFRLKGTVVTTATLTISPPEMWETRILTTHVTSSNIPFVNELLDDPKVELPVGDAYNTLLGKVPVVPFKTFYVDEGLRITRDVDDNFFVFTRA